MNRYTISMLSLFATFFMYSQEKESILKYLQLTETDSIYLKAVEKYIIELDSFYNTYSQNEQPKKIYIQYEDYLFKLPYKISGYEIIKLGLANRKKHFRKNKNRLRLVIMTPLTLKDGRFQVRLTPYFAKLKSRKHLDLALSDWTIVFFEFKNGKLKCAETQNGGI
ncbi:hypothetical protein H2O64_11140 [Kordia sp. YSTF-M3]|uniref:Uncharacterized protein n=1 Tax=Kordia aestuariivivens TaxID=2759037 RepID=A0ABR7Q9I9_9FLAO|nr:hypothetical protein [Kordia aestuariivivens]MBC8755231.1 hypothetical protein [Kordia aestuariivivens]